MSTTTNGRLANLAKTTALILFAREGTVDYLPLGNVAKFSHAPDVGRYEHMASQVGDAGSGGTKRQDGTLVTTIKHKWKVTLDEHTPATLRLLLMGEIGENVDQEESNSLGVSIDSVKKGFSYWIGAYGITDSSLTFDGSPATENVDYKLDAASGILTILASGGLDDDIPVAGNVGVPEVKYESYRADMVLRAAGSFHIFEFDQFEDAPRKHTTFDGEVYVTNWGEQTVETPNEFECEFLAISKPVVKERNDT